MKLSLPKLSLHRKHSDTNAKDEKYSVLLNSVSQISTKSLSEDTLPKNSHPTLPAPSLTESQFLPAFQHPGEEGETTAEDSSTESEGHETKNHPYHPPRHRIYRHQSSDHHEAVPAQLAASGQLHDHDSLKKQSSSMSSSEASSNITTEEERGVLERGDDASSVVLPQQQQQQPRHRKKKNPRGHEHHKRRLHK